METKKDLSHSMHSNNVVGTQQQESTPVFRRGERERERERESRGNIIDNEVGKSGGESSLARANNRAILQRRRCMCVCPYNGFCFVARALPIAFTTSGCRAAAERERESLLKYLETPRHIKDRGRIFREILYSIDQGSFPGRNPPNADKTRPTLKNSEQTGLQDANTHTHTHTTAALSLLPPRAQRVHTHTERERKAWLECCLLLEKERNKQSQTAPFRRRRRRRRSAASRAGDRKSMTLS